MEQKNKDKKVFELTIPQTNIWNLQKYYEHTSISNICGAIFWPEHIEYKQIQAALNRLVYEHCDLRTRFLDIEGTKAQYIGDYCEEEFTYESFSSREDLDSYAENEAKKPFEIEKSMYRFIIFDVNRVTGVLLVYSTLNNKVFCSFMISVIIDLREEVYYAKYS